MGWDTDVFHLAVFMQASLGAVMAPPTALEWPLRMGQALRPEYISSLHPYNGTIKDRCCYYPHFTEKKMESQRH